VTHSLSSHRPTEACEGKRAKDPPDSCPGGSFVISVLPDPSDACVGRAEKLKAYWRTLGQSRSRRRRLRAPFRKKGPADRWRSGLRPLHWEDAADAEAVGVRRVVGVGRAVDPEGAAAVPLSGRRRIDDRKVLTGILFVLRTGIPWEYLPQEMGCGSGVTCWRRLREWQRAAVWQRLHGLLLVKLHEAELIDWD
jgi:hypothetical protein